MSQSPQPRPARHVAACAALAIFAGACSSPDPEPGPLVQWGELEDVLAGAGPGAERVAPLPAEFLVGEAAQAELLLQHRGRFGADQSDPHLRTVLDVSQLAALDRTALTDRLLEAALDPGGPILLDRSGATARSLRAGLPGARRVRVDAASRIVANAPLSPSPN